MLYGYCNSTNIEILAALVDGVKMIFHFCDPWLNGIIAKLSLDHKHIMRLITYWRGSVWGLQKYREETDPSRAVFFFTFFSPSFLFLPQTDNIISLYIIRSDWHLGVSICSQRANPLYEATHYDG